MLKINNIYYKNVTFDDEFPYHGTELFQDVPYEIYIQFENKPITKISLKSDGYIDSYITITELEKVPTDAYHFLRNDMWAGYYDRIIKEVKYLYIDRNRKEYIYPNIVNSDFLYLIGIKFVYGENCVMIYSGEVIEEESNTLYILRPSTVFLIVFSLGNDYYIRNEPDW